MLKDTEIFARIQECERYIDDALIAVSEGRLPSAIMWLVKGFKRANSLNRLLIEDRGERTREVLSSIDKLVDQIIEADKE